MILNTKKTILIFILLDIALFSIFILKNYSSSSFRGDFSEIEKVKNAGMDFRSLSVFFTDLANEKGGEYAYKSLALAAKLLYIPPNIDLHLLGHVVGDILYKQEGIEGIKVCTNDLRNACSHSIVVGAFLEKGRPVLKEVVELCKLAPGGKGAFTMCVHGLGHGVLAFTEYDMKEAVKLCEDIGDPNAGDRIYTECAGGISMEMMAGVNDREQWEKEKPNYFSKTDPLSPCDLDFMPDAARPICYNFLTPHLFEFAGANLSRPLAEHYKKAFTYCNEIPKDRISERSSCYSGFGKEFVVLVNDRNVQSVENMGADKLARIYEWCSLTDDSQGRNNCMHSALASLYWGGENKPEAALKFCSLISNRDDNESCFNGLINAVGFYIDDQGYKKSFCAEVPEGLKENCRARLTRGS